MAAHEFDPVLVMLPDRSIRMFDCVPETSLTVRDVLRDYPGHELKTYPDSRKPSLDPRFSLNTKATYYLTVRRPASLQSLDELDADVTLSSVASTPSTTSSPCAQSPWSSSSPAGSNCHVAPLHTPTRRPGLVKSSSLKSKDDEQCSWNFPAASYDHSIRFSMPFPPRSVKNYKHSTNAPRSLKPPLSPALGTNSILKELQELEDAEKRSGSGKAGRNLNPILAELDEMEDGCVYALSRSTTTGHRYSTAFPAARCSMRSERSEVDSLKSEIEAVKIKLRTLAALGQRAGETESRGASKQEGSKKQPKSGAAAVLTSFRVFGRRKTASARMVTVEENKEKIDLPSCMDLDTLCSPQEADCQPWDWNPRPEMFYSMRL